MMKIPSLNKESIVQHRDNGIVLSIQWFFIESSYMCDIGISHHDIQKHLSKQVT